MKIILNNKEKKILTKKQLDDKLKNIEKKTKKNLESIDNLKDEIKTLEIFNSLLDMKRKNIYESNKLNDINIDNLMKTLPLDIINIIFKYYSLDNPLCFLINKTYYKLFNNNLFQYQITNIIQSLEDQLLYYNIVSSNFKFNDFFNKYQLNPHISIKYIQRERRMLIIVQMLFNKFINILSYTKNLNNEKTSKWKMNHLKSNKKRPYDKEINIVLDKDGRIFNLSEYEYNWMRKLICEIFNETVHNIIFGNLGNCVVYGISEQFCTYIRFV